MGSPLPEIPFGEFEARLRRVAPAALGEEAARRLHLHYLELRRWNPAVSLVGPGAGPEVVERLYGESLAALPLVPAGARRLVDLGSGAGFPGLVLAAARPELEVTLVEGRERKWAFLEAACARASLPCRCLNARVGRTLPEGFPQGIELLTMRALRPSADLLVGLSPVLAPGASLLLWVGVRGPDLPAPWVLLRSAPLPGSRRRIAEFRRRGEGP